MTANIDASSLGEWHSANRMHYQTPNSLFGVMGQSTLLVSYVSLLQSLTDQCISSSAVSPKYSNGGV